MGDKIATFVLWGLLYISLCAKLPIEMKEGVATMTETYFTIAHCDTHKPLGLGGNLDRQKALAILTTRKTGDDGAPFRSYEWYVTECYGDGSDDDEFVGSVSGEVFVSDGGRVLA